MPRRAVRSEAEPEEDLQRHGVPSVHRIEAGVEAVDRDAPSEAALRLAAQRQVPDEADGGRPYGGRLRRDRLRPLRLRQKLEAVPVDALDPPVEEVLPPELPGRLQGAAPLHPGREPVPSEDQRRGDEPPGGRTLVLRSEER